MLPLQLLDNIYCNWKSFNYLGDPYTQIQENWKTQQTSTTSFGMRRYKVCQRLHTHLSHRPLSLNSVGLHVQLKISLLHSRTASVYLIQVYMTMHWIEYLKDKYTLRVFHSMRTTVKKTVVWLKLAWKFYFLNASYELSIHFFFYWACNF